MKTLYPKQKEAFDFFSIKQKSGSNTLDTSHVGTGKTVVAAHLAKSLNRPVAVICPKAVIPSWERELKETGIEPLFVLNYEKIRTGKTSWMSKRGKKIMKWDLPEDTLVLVDEVHKCKGPYTQNAQLLVSLVAQGYSIHAMSATAAEDPTEMRPLGFALGLHSLNKPTDTTKSWFGWMMQFGCTQNEWNAWELRRKTKLNDLNKVMYGKNVKRLTVDDFPDSFKANRVFVEPVAFGSAAKIAKAYKDLDITPEIITNLLENGTVEDSDWVLVNLLRARQLAESLKAKDMADMARDYVEQGHSVVLFVNFTDTADTLQKLLKCPAIVGGQTADERQQIIDDFQDDKEHVIVVNIAAGGTGISLHDINGNRQRISLISPTFNVKDHLQALGRIHRNGAKSDAIQKILVASESIEEHVMRVIEQKSDNLNTLHQ
jgi:superfamily II DNA or RNA helicase